MTKEEHEDIKSTINWLLENGNFKDKETAYNSAMNSLNTLDEQLSIQGVSNCPNLTNLWNEAVFKQERNEHSIFDTNDCWGALRTLEKHGLCKINNY